MGDQFEYIPVVNKYNILDIILEGINELRYDDAIKFIEELNKSITSMIELIKVRTDDLNNTLNESYEHNSNLARQLKKLKEENKDLKKKLKNNEKILNNYINPNCLEGE